VYDVHEHHMPEILGDRNANAREFFEPT